MHLPSSPLNNENSPLVASLGPLPDDKMSSLCQCSWSLLSNCLIVFWPRRASWCRLSLEIKNAGNDGGRVFSLAKLMQ